MFFAACMSLEMALLGPVPMRCEGPLTEQERPYREYSWKAEFDPLGHRRFNLVAMQRQSSTVPGCDLWPGIHPMKRRQFGTVGSTSSLVHRLAVVQDGTAFGRKTVMKNWPIALILALGLAALTIPSAQAAPCMTVTITGSVGGPQAYQGNANAGTLVGYGDNSNNCSALRLQIDAGRGTLQRLSQIPITSAQLNAVFFTHMHNDHSEGFIDLIQNRWHIFPTSSKIDVVCSEDAPTALGVPISCRNFVAHVADALIQSGEIAQRRSEDRRRLEGGPAAMTNMMTFQPKDEPQAVWSSGDVKVSAIRSTHIAGHASYRVDTPAGSVVIGGDAGNDT